MIRYCIIMEMQVDFYLYFHLFFAGRYGIMLQMKQISRGRFIKCTVLFVIFFIFFIFFFSSIKIQPDPSVNPSWNTHWNIQINNTLFSNQILSDYHFPSLKKGDYIILTSQFPQKNYPYQVLKLHTYLSSFCVYIEDNEIYSYCMDQKDSDEFIGSGYHFIHLPEHCFGKEIKIILYVSEDHGFQYFSEPELYEKQTYLPSFLNSISTSSLIGGFIFGIGIILTLITPIAMYFSKEYSQLLYIGLFSSFVGIWTLCSSRFFQLLTNDLIAITFWEYFSLYCIPIPFLFMLINVLKNLTPASKKVLYMITSYLMTFFITALALHAFNIMHFPKTLVIFQISILLSIIILIPNLIRGIPKMNLSVKILFSSLLIVFIFTLLDIIRYNLYKYLFTNVSLLQSSILPFGTLFMIILMIISYLTSLFTSMADKKEKELLIQQAYTDGLTGLYNRAKCKLIFDELDSAKENYTIFSFDLNGLKNINDTYGHSAGDRLIIACSDFLKDVFEEYGDVIRMGGDEFVVVLRKLPDNRLNKIMKKFHDCLTKSEKKYGTKISVAYGSASNRDPVELSAKRIYEIADEKMYEMKKQSRLAYKK